MIFLSIDCSMTVRFGIESSNLVSLAHKNRTQEVTDKKVFCSQPKCPEGSMQVTLTKKYSEFGGRIQLALYQFCSKLPCAEGWEEGVGRELGGEFTDGGGDKISGREVSFENPTTQVAPNRRKSNLMFDPHELFVRCVDADGRVILGEKCGQCATKYEGLICIAYASKQGPKYLAYGTCNKQVCKPTDGVEQGTKQRKGMPYMQFAVNEAGTVLTLQDIHLLSYETEVPSEERVALQKGKQFTLNG